MPRQRADAERQDERPEAEEHPEHVQRRRLPRRVVVQVGDERVGGRVQRAPTQSEEEHGCQENRIAFRRGDHDERRRYQPGPGPQRHLHAIAVDHEPHAQAHHQHREVHEEEQRADHAEGERDASGERRHDRADERHDDAEHEHVGSRERGERARAHGGHRTTASGPRSYHRRAYSSKTVRL
jgi:hypothetical protein